MPYVKTRDGTDLYLKDWDGGGRPPPPVSGAAAMEAAPAGVACTMAALAGAGGWLASFPASAREKYQRKKARLAAPTASSSAAAR